MQWIWLVLSVGFISPELNRNAWKVWWHLEGLAGYHWHASDGNVVITNPVWSANSERCPIILKTVLFTHDLLWLKLSLFTFHVTSVVSLHAHKPINVTNDSLAVKTVFFLHEATYKANFTATDDWRQAFKVRVEVSLNILCTCRQLSSPIHAQLLNNSRSDVDV